MTNPNPPSSWEGSPGSGVGGTLPPGETPRRGPSRGLCRGPRRGRGATSQLPWGRSRVRALEGAGSVLGPGVGAPAGAPPRPSALAIAQGTFSVPSEAPGRGLIITRAALCSWALWPGFAASWVYYGPRGLGRCLDCVHVGGPLVPAQPSWIRDLGLSLWRLVRLGCKHPLSQAALSTPQTLQEKALE